MLINHLQQALQLFALGMGTVFALLSILIVSITLLSKLCKKQVEIDQQLNSTITVDQGVEPEIVAAVAIAIKKYKNRQ